MTSRYDDLSDRARWFLNNFDEIDLADLCAAHEASNQTREAAIDRVRAFAADVDNPNWRAPGTEIAARIRLALGEPKDTGPAHDDGPSIAEAAADDRTWDLRKAGE